MRIQIFELKISNSFEAIPELRAKKKTESYPVSLISAFSFVHNAAMAPSWTISQKMNNFIKHHRRRVCNESHTQKHLAIWAQKPFSLPQKPNQTTMYRILAATENITTSIQKATGNIVNLKRLQEDAAPRLEHALIEWINDTTSLRSF